MGRVYRLYHNPYIYRFCPHDAGCFGYIDGVVDGYRMRGQLAADDIARFFREERFVQGRAYMAFLCVKQCDVGGENNSVVFLRISNHEISLKPLDKKHE